MDMKKLACVLVLGGGLTAVGCGGDDDPMMMRSTPSPCGDGAAPTCSAGLPTCVGEFTEWPLCGDGSPAVCEGDVVTCRTATEPGANLTYVVNHLDVGQEDPMGTEGIVAGFNLDGVVSDDADPMGCFHTDYTSPAPDNEAGVDNQLGPILGNLGTSVDVTGTIAENIADGTLILFVEVEDVNNFVNDSDVTVNLLIGQLPAGCDPAATPPCPALSGDRLAPGQTFDVIAESYNDGAAAQNPMISAHGSIVNGRLTTEVTDIPLSLPIMDVVLNLNIRRARIRFNIAADGIEKGIIGGSLDIDELVAAVMAIPALAEYVDLLMTLLDMNADLDPDPAMMGDCQSVSLGLIFDGVTGVKGMVVARAM